MAQSTPAIEKNILVVQEGMRALEIAVGSAQWFEWLGRGDSTLFAFHASEGSYTARREGSGSGRGGWYWKAYRKHQGKLYRAYMGKAENLTPARLREIAQMLAERITSEGKAREATPGTARMIGKESRIEKASGRAQRSEHEVGLNPALTPLLETRLRLPRPPSQLVERAHLLALLDGGPQQKLTLLHAPAGFGKRAFSSNIFRPRSVSSS